MNSNSKIGRLPRALREHINQLLYDGVPGKTIIAWLNQLPEVQTVLRNGFGGRPINPPNLSYWKSGGYLRWLVKKETVEILGMLLQRPTSSSSSSSPMDGPAHFRQQLSDVLGQIVATHYATAIAGWDGRPTVNFRRRIRALSHLSREVSRLRRDTHASARLELNRQGSKWRQQNAANTSQFQQN